MTELTVKQRLRLLSLVERAYTIDTITRGGIVKTKTPKLREIEGREAHAVVDFVVDHVVDTYLAPAGLWDDLFQELLSTGILVRDQCGAVRSYRDRWDNLNA